MSLLRNLTRHTISKSPFLLSARLCSTQKLSSGLEKRLSAMVTAKDVVIFMKGVPNAPQCGFSNAVVQILKMHGVEDYDAHNVLEENELREVFSLLFFSIICILS